MENAEIAARIDSARQFCHRLLYSDGTYIFPKEYAGFPLATYSYGPGRNSFAGRPWGSTPPGPWENNRVKLTNCIWGGADYELMDVGMEDAGDWDYNEPWLEADRYYLPDGRVRYEITVQGYNGANPSFLYFGDYGMMYCYKGMGPQATRSYTMSTADPCHRYTVRHGCKFVEMIEDTWLDRTDIRDGAIRLRNLLGFTGDRRGDVYGSLWRYDTDMDHSFYSDWEKIWHDCESGVYESTPGFPDGNFWPHKYAYYSKVCNDPSLAIQYFKTCDSMHEGLEAIHALNQGLGPHHSVLGSTPLEICRSHYRDKWNGIGVYIPGPWGPGSDWTNAIRTCITGVLGMILSKRHGYSEFNVYVEQSVLSLTGSQWGHSPNATFYGKAVGGTSYLRPWVQGAPYSWFKFAAKTGTYYNEPPSTYGDILSWLLPSLPEEDVSLVPAIFENGAVLLQFLRVYLALYRNYYYPNTRHLP